MTVLKTSIGRREFLTSTALAGGGMMIGFSWLAGCQRAAEQVADVVSDEWFEINAYLSIASTGRVTIKSPNPEFGQNVITSMPMIVAEELDVDWQDVVVEQALFNADRYDRQFTGGSQGIRRGWQGLRMAGAAARQMLREAAAAAWQVPAAEITTRRGMLHHAGSGNSAGYGEFADAAAGIPVPETVQLKDVADFSIVGTARRNVEGPAIVSGKPIFTSDYRREGMLYAMIVHPPAFGMRLKSVDDAAARTLPGVRDIFTIKTFEDDYERNAFDTNTFPELVAVVGDTTWQVMNAKQALEIEWEEFEEHSYTASGFGGDRTTVVVPAGLESTADHLARMEESGRQPGTVLRRDGDPEAAFARAETVIERTYTAPFLAHNCMEPIVCFAHVTADHAELVGPIQAPELIEGTLSARLGLPREAIDIRLARMGGGFGSRAYGHYMVETALISRQVDAPILLVYTREDDMTFGLYRPTYRATYRAALDAEGNLTAFHLKAGGIPDSPVSRRSANRFPVGSVDNCLVENWSVDSNITVAAFRAPGSNFLAGAEQSFLDEVAEAAGKDPIAFRLELLERAGTDPVGELDYDAARYAGVLELVREKSGWDEQRTNASRGVSAYFCHATYAAEVVDIVLDDNKPVIERVCCALDCGIVVNPDAAMNMAEGAIVDGIGNALYGGLAFSKGVPEMSNFHDYRMIRMADAPKRIDVHFVQNSVDPTGLGEPPFPPVFAAVANALYKATGKRYYDQPFLADRRTA